ncbi:hypothetical protein NBRC3293_3120 [Gluconobacter oxydans NBRC 3293]|uniref:Uncharacterized protein n=1 Tax=Gluconobacter oxydans NBRC 3293 TaxID=1315969 RepID=A0A829WTA7_GLUOY|nr:hypothetical protein NBRC3293_2932 [Gluconobacter oxydans NBRC 3293]GEM18623.1 hypothetical protein NBRC3293_3120 [Gluconobacter oxydans NBRC 3293]
MERSFYDFSDVPPASRASQPRKAARSAPGLSLARLAGS